MNVGVYNLQYDGGLALSKNFRVREFACHDGSQTVMVADELVRLLQALRDYKGMPVHITSGYRTRAHNRAVGGVPNSQHCLGKAADITVAANSPRQVWEAIESGRVPGIDPDLIGMGLYETFVHIDCRGFRARWFGKGVRP